MAVEIAPGVTWVIYNDSHALTRVRATLMEEFFHLRFNHAPSSIRVYPGNGNPRSFSQPIEKEAYHTGAAVLLPYRALKQMVTEGAPVTQIAKHFDVSPELVGFRAKVTKLYSRLSR